MDRRTGNLVPVKSQGHPPQPPGPEATDRLRSGTPAWAISERPVGIALLVGRCDRVRRQRERLDATLLAWWGDRCVRQWLSRLPEPLPFRANATCPICSSPIVLLPTTYTGSHYTRPMMVPRTREERVAACHTHGRSPFNDLSVKALNDRAPD